MKNVKFHRRPAFLPQEKIDELNFILKPPVRELFFRIGNPFQWKKFVFAFNYVLNPLESVCFAIKTLREDEERKQAWKNYQQHVERVIRNPALRGMEESQDAYPANRCISSVVNEITGRKIYNTLNIKGFQFCENIEICSTTGPVAETEFSVRTKDKSWGPIEEALNVVSGDTTVDKRTLWKSQHRLARATASFPYTMAREYFKRLSYA